MMIGAAKDTRRGESYVLTINLAYHVAKTLFDRPIFPPQPGSRAEAHMTINLGNAKGKELTFRADLRC